MRFEIEVIDLRDMLNSLLDGDDFKPCLRGSPEQELATLVMRDMCEWFLMKGRGNKNITLNVEALKKLLEDMRRMHCGRA